MKKPFAYVLYIEQDNAEHEVSLHQTLDKAEDALRDFAASIFVGPIDDEIVEVLAGGGKYARIYECAKNRGTQISTEIKPFTRAVEVA